MRNLRKALISAVAGLALAVSGASAASACTHPTVPATPTVTYAFYSGSDSPADALTGWMYSDNTDYEDDSDYCETTNLGPITTYVCTVPLSEAPSDAALIVSTTDDGDLVYLHTGTVLSPANGGN